MGKFLNYFNSLGSGTKVVFLSEITDKFRKTKTVDLTNDDLNDLLSIYFNPENLLFRGKVIQLIYTMSQLNFRFQFIMDRLLIIYFDKTTQMTNKELLKEIIKNEIQRSEGHELNIIVHYLTEYNYHNDYFDGLCRQRAFELKKGYRPDTYDLRSIFNGHSLPKIVSGKHKPIPKHLV